MTKKRTKVAILGYSDSLKDAPFDNPEYEVWSCNEGDVKRFDRHFELHPMVVQNERELAWLAVCKKPVYVLHETPLIPEGIVYPLDNILKQPWARHYFTCTFAYEIALALYEGFETIGLWGTNSDQGSPRERTIESACIQFWMGVAIGKGVEVIWPDDPAKNRYAYGYEYFAEKWNVENWLCRLAIQTIYRVGLQHVSIGGDFAEIRRYNKDLL